MKKFQVINIGCDDVRLLFVETKSMTQEAKSQNLFDIVGVCNENEKIKKEGVGFF